MGCLMQITIKFKDDVPLMLAKELLETIYEQCSLFDLVSKVHASFDEGEEERMQAVQNSRVKQIS